MWSARRESQLKSVPREAGGNNPSRCHETESRRENGLTSKTYKRHAERVRTSCAQVLGKAGTDPLERRGRRGTEADDAEQFLTPKSVHECHESIQSVRPKLTCPHCHHVKKQVDNHLQTSVASHTSVVEPERGAVTQR